jgi:hypothetical protein
MPSCLRFFGILLDRFECRGNALLGKFEPVGDLSIGVGAEAFLEHGSATGKELPRIGQL